MERAQAEEGKKVQGTAPEQEVHFARECEEGEQAWRDGWMPTGAMRE